MELNSDLLGLLALGSLLPLVVTAATKWQAPDWVKNLVNLLLATVVGAVDTAVDATQAGAEFSWRELFTSVAVTWAWSTFAYMKLWKNNPVSVALGRATENVGVGGPLGPTSKPAPPPVMSDNPYPGVTYTDTEAA